MFWSSWISTVRIANGFSNGITYWDYKTAIQKYQKLRWRQYCCHKIFWNCWYGNFEKNEQNNPENAEQFLQNWQRIKRIHHWIIALWCFETRWTGVRARWFSRFSNPDSWKEWQLAFKPLLKWNIFIWMEGVRTRIFY